MTLHLNTFISLYLKVIPPQALGKKKVSDVPSVGGERLSDMAKA
jgi:hypothetical protein